MKKIALFLFILAIASMAILASISKEPVPAVENQNKGSQQESYNGFDMFSKYNLY